MFGFVRFRAGAGGEAPSRVQPTPYLERVVSRLNEPSVIYRAPLPMSLRQFTDSAARRWQVWDTYSSTVNGEIPTSALSHYVDTQSDTAADCPPTMDREFRVGWLTFTSGDVRRRLVPVPPTWDGCDEAGLCALLDSSRESLAPTSKPEAAV